MTCRIFPPRPDPCCRFVSAVGIAGCLVAVMTAIAAGSDNAESDKQQTATRLPPPAKKKIDFARDVAPILAKHCYDCHGPEEQESLLRLDARKIVLKGGLSGPALVPGKSSESLIVQRLAGLGDGERMPLDADPLTDDQIGLIRAWIDQGAVWPEGVGVDVASIESHWAYVKPTRPAEPEVKRPEWVRNPIDAFVLARLEKEQLAPSPEAEPTRLLRRVYLDLIGIPPSVEEVDAFLNDDRPDAYERVVKRLLASPHYGERWARPWLDLARYADSNGYQADQYREVWPYRDWVIQAMNDDMPFDRFTIEQIAGDLLPDATLNQKTATGFHRQTTCNVEAGVDPEENRVNQVIDRVNTTGTVWLGTTVECIQCHNHKYDPFTQRDYYGLFAFFNNTPLEVKHSGGTTYDFYGPKLALPLTDQQQQQLAELKERRDQLLQQLQPFTADLDEKQRQWEAEQAAALAGAAQDAESKSGLADDVVKILNLPKKKRSKQQKQRLRDFYVAEHHPQVKKLEDQVAAVKKRIAAVKPTTTLVMVEQTEPRTTHIFQRGSFLTPGEEVAPGTPRALHEMPADLPRNRLGLAKWLVDENNPLVARVTVNRWWAEIFGRGIVRTEEDFGTQGELPTHPDLLDWLAVEFVESGWSMKHVHERIVTSATYRQSSRTTTELLRRDPHNELLARGPRFRLPAELVRDNALAVSGLICTKAGGPPVFPPQPPGIWRHVGRNAPKYKVATDEDRFRRGIYTIWRRSAPYPAFVNFDAPDRAACVVQRPRTNTPLQSLTLLNDEAYVEMALILASRMAAYSEASTDRDRVIYGFRRCVARRPSDFEADHLLAVYERELARFHKDPKSAHTLIGKTALPDGVTAEQLAAWFYVANILMNLDETITKG